jgi:hypothetical protein
MGSYDIDFCRERLETFIMLRDETYAKADAEEYFLRKLLGALTGNFFKSAELEVAFFGEWKVYDNI